VVVSSAIASPFALACQVGADAPLEVNTYPAVPVDPARARVLEMSMVVNFADVAVVAPMVMLFIVPTLVGAISK
jgi:hypothetical protein